MSAGHHTWREIADGMRRCSGPARSSPGEGAFWSDFRARARLRVQEEPEARVATPALALRWAAAATCALLVAASAVWIPQRLAAGRTGGGGVVRSLEVVAPHSAVMIMQDEASRGTIVWVVDMQSGDAGESS